MKRYNKLISKIIINIFIFIVLVSTSNVKVFAADNTKSSLEVGKSIVKQYYIGNVSEATINGATDMQSLVKSLNDPYSAYFTPEQYNDFTGSINNTFSGIGISIGNSLEGIKVVSVFDKTPAKEAGLLLGDIITEADGHALAGLSSEVATSYVRGVTGTSVHLGVKRGNIIILFDIIRKAIVLPTVIGTLIDKHIGYISISSFGETTATEFKNVHEGLKNNSADSYIVDLRNNGGGYMDTAFDIAGYFIGDNVVLKVQPKNGTVTNYNVAEKKESIDKPVIFLINHYSASASEILSAAVKDYKKALFIGEKTYGKGVAQSMYTLPDKSYLKLTVFKFFSPLGKEINKVGITPDLEVIDDAKLGIDSLSAARILFSNLSNNAGKSELAEVSLAGGNYKVNLDVAKAKENINTFKYLETNYIFKPVSAVANINSNQTLKADTVDVKSVQIIKAVATSKQLPETGTPYDFYFYIGLGSVVMAAGLIVILKSNINKKEKNSF